MWMAARMPPTGARPTSGSRVTASAWAETGRKAPRAAWPGSRPARLRYRVHLFRLAEIPDPAPAGAAGQLLSPEVRAILDQLVPMPANVVTERFDILAWNAAYATLFPPPTDPARSERNSLLYCFTQPACCGAIENHADRRAMEQLVEPARRSRGSPAGRPTRPGRGCPSPSRTQFGADQRKPRCVTGFRVLCAKGQERR